MPLKERRARYRSVIALADGKKLIGVVSGSCSGTIAVKEFGKNGFGYDPLFLIARYAKTFGQLDSAVKAKISHRARALKKFRKLLQGRFL